MEKNYKFFIENLNEGVWVIDKEANTTYVNQSMAKMLGYSIDEMMGKPLFGFMDEQGVAIAGHNLKRRKKGISEKHDFEFLRKDGGRFYAIVNTSAITNKNGEYIGAIAGVMDITERRAIEISLKDSQERYHALFDQANDSIVFFAVPDGKIMDFNKSAYRNLGYSKKEFEKISLADIEVVESQSEIAKRIKKIFNEGSAIFETKHKRKDGEIRDILVRSTTIMLAGKAYIQSVWTDITDQKEVEREAQENKNALEMQIEDRTQDLQKLNTALKVLLDQREAEKSELQANVDSSVNLFILPYLAEIEKTHLTARQKTYIEIIRSAIGKITTSFSRSVDTFGADFTPMERKVALLIKSGKTSKEIADILSLSFDTISFHRKKIRTKLGIANKNINLMRYMQSIM